MKFNFSILLQKHAKEKIVNLIGFKILIFIKYLCFERREITVRLKKITFIGMFIMKLCFKPVSFNPVLKYTFYMELTQLIKYVYNSSTICYPNKSVFACGKIVIILRSVFKSKLCQKYVKIKIYFYYVLK